MPDYQLTNDWAKQHMARLVPNAYFDPDTKHWTVSNPDAHAANYILKLFPDLSVTHPELVDLRDKELESVRPFDNATPYAHHIEAEAVAAALAHDDKALYEFQSLDLGYMAAVIREHGAGYIGWERGLGKTIAALCLVDSLDARAVLVVCPNTAKQSVWADEIERFLPGHRVVVMPNEKRKREECLEECSTLSKQSSPFILVTHYESLALVAGKGTTKTGRTSIGDGWRKLGIEWDIRIADEAHRFWNPKTQMYRAARKIPGTAWLMLSGTIIQNHAEELFGPLGLMFPDRYRSKWRDWNDRYLEFVEVFGRKVCVGVKPDRVEELRAELGVFTVYRRKSDELDLPPRREQTLFVDLTPTQRRAYDELVQDSLARLDDGSVVKAPEGVALFSRLRQCASGLDTLAQVDDSAKLDLAVQLIEDSDEPVVVFTWYKANGRTLQARLADKGIESFLCDGDVPHEQRSEYIRRFQAGEGKVFIGTIATLSESVTLTRATQAIFVDRSFNPGQNSQAGDRIYRIGQTLPVLLTYIVARNTVDELSVLPALASKEALRRIILGGD